VSLVLLREGSVALRDYAGLSRRAGVDAPAAIV